MVKLAWLQLGSIIISFNAKVYLVWLNLKKSLLETFLIHGMLELVSFFDGFMYFIYLLRCNNNSLYCGYTTDLALRVHHHLYKKSGAKYTKIFLPVGIACAWRVAADRSFTLKIEYAIKQLTKEKKEALVSAGNIRDISLGVPIENACTIARISQDELDAIWMSCQMLSSNIVHHKIKE